jgi:phospholipid/cholesterol/gamma-HCH transport system substrate-binding protein
VRRSRRSRFRLGDVTVAFIAIAFMIAGAYGAFTKRVPFVHGYEVNGMFASSNQLIKGSPVRVAGVNVGTVRKLAPGPGHTELVTLEIKNEGRPIHKDATLKIRPRLFLEGGFYVEVRPGSPGSPELKSGDTIPLPQTSIPVQFHQVLLALNRPTRTSLRSTIDSVAAGLESGGARGLNRTNRALAPVLRDTALISAATLGRSPHDLSNFIDDSSQVAQSVAQHDTQLEDLVTGLNRTSTTLARHDLALAGTVRETDRVMRDAPSSLRALDRAFPTVTRFSVDLLPSLQIAPPVLSRAVDALVQLNAIAGPAELPSLITTLRPAITQLPTLTRRLDTLFPLVTPVTQCVLTRAGPVLFAKLNDGNLSTGRPVYQEMLDAFSGLASASQNYDANGPAIRYLTAGGDDLVALNGIPTLGQIFESTSKSNPVLGSRPLWLGSDVAPPYHPEANCAAQAFPDLQARTGLDTATGTSVRARPRVPVTPQILEQIANGTTGASGATDATGAAAVTGLTGVAGVTGVSGPGGGN